MENCVCCKEKNKFLFEKKQLMTIAGMCFHLQVSSDCSIMHG